MTRKAMWYQESNWEGPWASILLYYVVRATVLSTIRQCRSPRKHCSFQVVTTCWPCHPECGLILHDYRGIKWQRRHAHFLQVSAREKTNSISSHISWQDLSCRAPPSCRGAWETSFEKLRESLLQMGSRPQSVSLSHMKLV